MKTTDHSLYKDFILCVRIIIFVIIISVLLAVPIICSRISSLDIDPNMLAQYRSRFAELFNEVKVQYVAFLEKCIRDEEKSIWRHHNDPYYKVAGDPDNLKRSYETKLLRVKTISPEHYSDQAVATFFARNPHFLVSTDWPPNPQRMIEDQTRLSNVLEKSGATHDSDSGNYVRYYDVELASGAKGTFLETWTHRFQGGDPPTSAMITFRTEYTGGLPTPSYAWVFLDPWHSDGPSGRWIKVLEDAQIGLNGVHPRDYPGFEPLLKYINNRYDRVNRRPKTGADLNVKIDGSMRGIGESWRWILFSITDAHGDCIGVSIELNICPHTRPLEFDDLISEMKNCMTSAK